MQAAELISPAIPPGNSDVLLSHSSERESHHHRVSPENNMLVGVPKEIKNHEYRVGLTPASVQELVAHGHQIRREQLKNLRPGSVLVDVSIDQGGCFETSRPTTHTAPTYLVDDIVHYCVANMPGAVARTSTFALNNATLPFVLALADHGYRRALQDDPRLRSGLNVHQGKLICAPVGEALGIATVDAQDALKI